MSAPPTPEFGVRTDERVSGLRRMLNLLANAVKYNRDGGSVAVFHHLDLPDHLSIWVTDTGPGNAPGDKERLFFPFDRLSADRAGVEGTGLGWR